jgi:glycosyltransferase involved in cell wall biosynthesis
MKILYHITSPPPRIPGTDALYQEAELLESQSGAGIIRWYPLSAYTPYLPPFLYGFHQLVKIWKKEQECDIHHIFHSVWYPFPLLALLRKPVVFTVSAGLAYSLRYAPQQKVHLVLSSEHEQRQAIQRGWENTSVVYPGIVAEGLDSVGPQEITGEFVLLAGSAPWVDEQFVQKGFDIMLRIVKDNPEFRLITLWRGHLFHEWKTMIDQYGVSARVEVYNTWVDIAALLPRVHAAIVLADREGIVKAWPHSLLEGLVAGRPVIISRTIPMASFVEEKGVGIVIEKMDTAEVENAVHTLKRDYGRYQKAASHTGHRFSPVENIREYRDIYTKILAKKE